jgi:hypothetical protein
MTVSNWTMKPLAYLSSSLVMLCALGCAELMPARESKPRYLAIECVGFEQCAPLHAKAIERAENCRIADRDCSVENRDVATTYGLVMAATQALLESADRQNTELRAKVDEQTEARRVSDENRQSSERACAERVAILQRSLPARADATGDAIRDGEALPTAPEQPPIIKGQGWKPTKSQPAAAAPTGGLMCNDGTLSPSCACGGSHRGCCSHHHGVAGCQ